MGGADVRRTLAKVGGLAVKAAKAAVRRRCGMDASTPPRHSRLTTCTHRCTSFSQRAMSARGADSGASAAATGPAQQAAAEEGRGEGGGSEEKEKKKGEGEEEDNEGKEEEEEKESEGQQGKAAGEEGGGEKQEGEEGSTEAPGKSKGPVLSYSGGRGGARGALAVRARGRGRGRGRGGLQPAHKLDRRVRTIRVKGAVSMLPDVQLHARTFGDSVVIAAPDNAEDLLVKFGKRAHAEKVMEYGRQVEGKMMDMQWEEAPAQGQGADGDAAASSGGGSDSAENGGKDEGAPEGGAGAQEGKESE